MFVHTKTDFMAYGSLARKTPYPLESLRNLPSHENMGAKPFLSLPQYNFHLWRKTKLINIWTYFHHQRTPKIKSLHLTD